MRQLCVYKCTSVSMISYYRRQLTIGLINFRLLKMPLDHLTELAAVIYRTKGTECRRKVSP